MRVGFVYDLREEYLAAGLPEEQAAEFDTAETIGLIAGAIERAGHEVTRIGNGRALAAALVAGKRWDLIFSIAEGLKGRNREGQVPSLCELFDQPYAFSDALTLSATLDKAIAKRLVRDAGVPTAPFAVLHKPEDARGVDLGWPVFVKPIAGGHGQGLRRGLESLRRKGARSFRRQDHLGFSSAGNRRTVPARARIHGRHDRHRRRG